MTAKKSAKKKKPKTPLTKLIPSWLPYRMGRPPKYDPAILPLVKHCAGKLAYTEDHIARVLGLSSRTVDLWKIEHPDFLRALRRGKAESNVRVEESLFNRAVGFTRQIETRTCVIDTKTGKPIDNQERVTFTEQYFPPSEVAQRYWLGNRDEGRWKERKILAHTNDGDKPLKTEDVTPIERRPDLVAAYAARMALAARGADPGSDPDLERDGRPRPGPSSKG